MATTTDVLEFWRITATVTAEKSGASFSLSFDALLAKARELSPLVSDQGISAEKQGRLTDTTVSTLRQSGLLSLFVPRALGGAELWPAPGIEIIETLTRADGSTGWVVMATQVAMATCAAYLPPTAAKTVFKNQFPLLPGKALRSAEPIQTGTVTHCRETGATAAVLLHSEWIHTGAIVHHNGAPRIDPRTQQPDARIFIVPVDKAALQNNWDVLGLRATGSVDYSMRDVAVAEEYTHSLGVKRPQTGGDLYRLVSSGSRPWAIPDLLWVLRGARWMKLLRWLHQSRVVRRRWQARAVAKTFSSSTAEPKGSCVRRAPLCSKSGRRSSRRSSAAPMQRCDRYRSRGSRLLMRTPSRRQLPTSPLISAAGPRCAPEIFNNASEISVRRLSISQRPRISFASARRTCLALHKEKFGICGNWLTLERAALPVAISAGIQSI